jgi:hypothetical protein
MMGQTNLEQDADPVQFLHFAGKQAATLNQGW